MAVESLYIIILSYNGGSDLIECYKSVAVSTVPDGWERRILIVDNNSSDGEVERLKNCKIIKNKENLGFAAGNNVGIRYALKRKAEAILLLNQDTKVEKDFLFPLLSNQADIVSPVIKFKRSGKWIYDYGGKVNWWIGRTKHIETDKLPVASCQFPLIDYVSGCAILIRRPVFAKVGLLNKKYFLYFEDVDFCIKAKKAGFSIGVEPDSMIIHKLLEKCRKPIQQQIHQIRSNRTFINQNLKFYQKPFAYCYLLLFTFKIIFNSFSIFKDYSKE